ncbi:hypothetical protein H310_15137, partial [Aphanomyces invadans]
MRQLDSVIELGGFMEDMKLKVDHEVKLRLTFDTAVGTLMLTNLKCWVAAAPLQVGLGDLIVSRDEMARLGRPKKPRSLYPDEERACFPDLQSGWLMEVDRMAVRALLDEKVRDCEGAGCAEVFATQLSRLLHGAEPVRCKARLHTTHVAELVSAGLCYRNPRAKWCSAPLIVKKPDANDFHMTVDVRPVNAPTERIIWPMPMLEVIVDHLAEKCHQRGLKLNPKKCRFYETESRWCWRILSSDGVKQDPERIKELQDLKMPPMTDLIESVYKAACGRTRQKVAKVALADVGWSAAHAACLTAYKQALSRVVTLAHPKQDRLICVLADASDLHWGEHEPLMFLSGTFSGAAQRWVIVEKEAFSIVECLKRADYLLHKTGGFALFTDHDSWKFIFDPASVNAAILKYTAAKLDRWVLLLMSYNYTIYYIADDVN